MKNMRSSEILYRNSVLPEKDATFAGYSALIFKYNLSIPRPVTLSVISKQHRRYDTKDWRVFTPRHRPNESLAGHLTFALKYEGLDLALLHALFQAVNSSELEAWIHSEPLGQFSRRAWFFYEWLMEKRLDIFDVQTGNYVDALDSKQQYPGPSIPSPRHRVRNNLPGVRDFCPLIRRTAKLEALLEENLQKLALEKTVTMHPDVLARAAAFLLLKDTRASFAIEGETPGKNRAERWGRALWQAGLQPLSLAEMIRLQNIVIEDKRFVKLGLRDEGGFIGVHDRATGEPIPDHISANWQDLPCLMNGLITAYERMRTGPIDPVLMAAIIAFGFVFIHPFADGNGRIQRYLIHHILADRDYTPKGIIFPVSAVMLRRVEEYKQILEAYSRPRVDFIEWKATNKGNVDVLNDTIDLYRYFDATPQAEFLFDCVRETITEMLPDEIRYLEQYDQMKTAIGELFDMPAYRVDLLIRFMEQNNGKISKRARDKEFNELTDGECLQLEELYKKITL